MVELNTFGCFSLNIEKNENISYFFSLDQLYLLRRNKSSLNFLGTIKVLHFELISFTIYFFIFLQETVWFWSATGCCTASVSWRSLSWRTPTWTCPCSAWRRCQPSSTASRLGSQTRSTSATKWTREQNKLNCVVL